MFKYQDNDRKQITFNGGMTSIINKIIILLLLSASGFAQAAITFINSTSGNNVGGGVAITFVGSNSASSTNTNSLTITLPASTAVDDVMVAQVARRGGGTETFTAPAGWTQIGTDLHIPATGSGGNTHKHRAYYKVVTAADLAAGNATWTFTGNQNNVGGISTYRNADTVNPIQMSSENGQTGNSTLVTATGFTTTVDDTMLIAFYGINANRTYTGPAGYTQRYEQPSGSNNIEVMTADMLQATAGATGNATTTLSANNNRRVGRLIALNPAGNSLTIAVPAGTSNNDVMIAAIAVRPSTITIGAPSGWTFLLRTDQAAGNSNSQSIYYRVATASEPASYTWTFSGGTHTGAVGGILSYSGVDTTSPIDVSGGNTTASSTSHTANSVTTTVANAMLISTHSYSSAQNWTPPAGMTERVDVFSTVAPSGGGIAMEMNDELLTAVGATGSRTAVAAASADTGVGQMLALTPFAVSGGITVTLTGSVDNINAGSISITNATPGSPEASNTNTETADGTDTITTTITTLSNNAWLIDTVGDGNAGSFTPGAGQTERWDTAAASSTGAMSTKAVATAGLDSMAQTYNTNSNRIAHAVVAVAPADPGSTIAFDAAASADTGGAGAPSSLNWSHALATSETIDTKLIVGISIEEPSGCATGRVSSVTYGNISLTQVATILVDDTYCHQVEIWYADLTNIIVSTNNNSTLGGQAIDQDEAVEYDVLNDTGSLFFDDATFSANERLTAIHQYTNGNLAISTAGDANIGGNGFGDDDIVEVTPSATAGVYDFVQILFDGGTHFSAANEDVDAVYVRDNGNIALSTIGNATLPACGGGSINFGDDDLIEWDVNNTCGTSIINFSPLISACGGNGDEDVVGVHYLNDDPNLVLLSLINNCTIDSQVFSDGDVILYNRNSSSASLYFDENNFTSGNEDIDALTLAVPAVFAPVLDHYAITYPGGTPGLTCEAINVRITAHESGHTSTEVNPGNATTVNIATSTGAGTWQAGVVSGAGIWSPSGNDDGMASYTWPGSEEFFEVQIRHTVPASAPDLHINLLDNLGNTEFTISPPDEDPQLDVVDVAFRFTDTPLVAGSGTAITTKIAGKDSNSVGFGQQNPFYIQAIQTDTNTGSCVGVFQSQTVTIDMASECEDPAVCVAPGGPGTAVQVENNTPAFVPIGINNSSAGTPGNYLPVTLDFGVNSEALLNFNYSDVGRITLHARYDIDPDVGVVYMTGASNSFGGGFVVRPFGFDIDSGLSRAADWGDATFDCDDSNSSCALDASAATVLAKAGYLNNNFPVTIRSVAWQSADDGDSNGVPDTGANLTDNATTPNFGQETTTELVDITSGNVRPTNTGTLFLGNDLDFTGSSGSLTTNLAFDEVGIIDLTASLDSGNYLSGGSGVSSTHENYGRFTPDRFTIPSDNNPSFANACTSGASPFTYQDQSFYFGSGTAAALTVRALNEAGGTTVNYGDTNPSTAAGRFWKLASTLTRTYSNQAAAAATFSDVQDVTVNLSGDLDYDGEAVLALNELGNGDAFAYSRVSEEMEFNADVDLTFTVGTLTDSDNVCYDPDDDESCDSYSSTGLSGAALRFGRLSIGNAFGSELLPVALPVKTQYFNGTSFVDNTDDACMQLALTDLALTSAIEVSETDGDVDISNAASCGGSGLAIGIIANTPFVNGDAGLSFSVAAPAAACVGFVDTTLDLSAISLTIGSLLYPDLTFLQFDWDGLGAFDDNPSGRASFGIFQGPREFIYLREPWN
jgi:Family of unknown function (DUF6701)